MFHWMLVASQAIKSVLRVANFFSNKKRRTFSRSLYAHISLQVKHLTQVCEGEKQSQFLSNTLPLWFWWRMRLVVHFRDKILSFVLWNIMFQKSLFITMSKRICFIFQPIFPHFFQYIGRPKGPDTHIVASSDSISYLIYRVFRWYILTFFCYCTEWDLWCIFVTSSCLFCVVEHHVSKITFRFSTNVPTVFPE